MTDYRTLESVAYDFILENELTTEEGLAIGTSVGGWNMETLNHIIYYKTGMHDIEQCWNCARDEFYFSDEVKAYFIDEEDEEENEEE